MDSPYSQGPACTGWVWEAQQDRCEQVWEPGQQGNMAGLSWSFTRWSSPRVTGAADCRGETDWQTPNSIAFQPGASDDQMTLCGLVNWPLHTEGKETEERGRPLQIGRWQVSQGNLLLSLVIPGCRMGRFLCPLSRCTQSCMQMVSTTPSFLKAISSRQQLMWALGAGSTFQGPGSLLLRVQLAGHLQPRPLVDLLQHPSRSQNHVPQGISITLREKRNFNHIEGRE